MKKVLMASLFLASFSLGLAQSDSTAASKPQDKDLMTWYHKDFATTQVYGINTQGAYQYLDSKGLKPKTVIVGVLDSGVEVDHPGLIKNMWVNPKEIPNNGIDDDGNGYVDDVHGWNFLGSAKGDVDVDNLEVTRIVRKYKPIFEGEDSSKNKENQVKFPQEFQDYILAKKIFDEKSGESTQQYQFYSKIKELIPVMDRLMQGKTLTQESVATIQPKTQDDAISLQILMMLIANDPEAKGKKFSDIKENFQKDIDAGIKHFSSAFKQYDLNFDPRAELVGDNYDDYSERKYGNNHYEGPDAMHGTHVAGIIAGYPHDNEIQYGVAYKVAKIMTVRAVPDGDERDKDVANAIRYAVDNGAKVLNMSFGKPVSPGKNYVWDAMKYAQQKGVLLVKAAGNDNQDVEKNVAYPTNFKNPSDPAPFVDNVLVVGASTKDKSALKASFSNFNKKMVNVFAPGTEIYSTVPDAKYEYLQGTSMASPVVAGAAAVLLAYMPELKPYQVIEALVKTANPSNSVSTKVDDSNYKTFNTLSVSGGVIDLRKAAEYAYTNFYGNGHYHKSKAHKAKVKSKNRARAAKAKATAL